jgi:hypothetical protein
MMPRKMDEKNMISPRYSRKSMTNTVSRSVRYNDLRNRKSDKNDGDILSFSEIYGRFA